MSRKVVQLTLFGGWEEVKAIRTNNGGSQNPIVFNDYDSYVAKFNKKDHKMTTDDTYTPQDVYEAVVRYVNSIYPLEGKQILRPFYPGGDYEKAEYPENGVVIDNPPFSIFTKICKFYSRNNIPFFLFGPGMTILSIAKYCSAIVISQSIKYHNGACVATGFATNLLGNTMVTTAQSLDEDISKCPSQGKGKSYVKKARPDNIIGVGDIQAVARRRDVDFSITRGDASLIDKNKGVKLFGKHLWVNDDIAKEIKSIKMQETKTQREYT